MLARMVCFGLAMIVGAGVVAEERKAKPVVEFSAAMEYRISNSSDQTIVIETASFVKKSRTTHSRLAEIGPFKDTSGSTTVRYNLQSRQLNGFDFVVVAQVGRKTADRKLTINDGSNLPASYLINPKTEFLEIFVYDDAKKNIFMNVFTRKKA